jgi:hypothetical protein
MADEQQYQDNQDRIAEFQRRLTERLNNALLTDPRLADAIAARIQAMVDGIETADRGAPVPPDHGLAALAGVGPDSSPTIGLTRVPPSVLPYDDTVSSERISAVADLYYIYQHERIGVFKVVQKLQELFRAGAVRLSGGDGAFGLYQFDRRDVLRYTLRDRRAAYRRAFGYGRAPVPAGARANSEFHPLFTHFVNQVTLYWRDKRISDVIRERAYDPSFGSVAVVRRSGLDLRNNLKFMSFGHINVLRIEVMQLLEDAFRILSADDVRNLFGAANAWDVVEEVLVRYFNQRLVTSPRQRMAVTGRDMLRWLSQPFVLTSQRAQFEAQLLGIAEPAEEWLTSAQALGLAVRTGSDRILPWDSERPGFVAAGAARRRPRPPRRASEVGV